MSLGLQADAHSDELAASNEAMWGELTVAKAATAWLSVDVGHYQGQCERLELALDTLRGEKDGEARGGGRQMSCWPRSRASWQRK